MLARILLCLCVFVPASWVLAQGVYIPPVRGTTAALPATGDVTLVNPDQGMIYVGAELIGAPRGTCTALAGAKVVVEGSDYLGVLVEYQPPTGTPPAAVATPCPPGALYLIPAADWLKLAPVYGQAEAAAAAQKERVRRMLMP